MMKESCYFWTFFGV